QLLLPRFPLEPDRGRQRRVDETVRVGACEQRGPGGGYAEQQIERLGPDVQRVAVHTRDGPDNGRAQPRRLNTIPVGDDDLEAVYALPAVLVVFRVVRRESVRLEFDA